MWLIWEPASIGCSLSAHHAGTQRTCNGHRQTKWWALIARTVGIECPFYVMIFGHYFRQANLLFPVFCWLQFCVFVQCFMVIWWYFYGNHDTSMTLLCKHIWKCHFANRYVSVIYLQTMILWDFLKKKHLCARIKEWVNLRHL